MIGQLATETSDNFLNEVTNAFGEGNRAATRRRSMRCGKAVP